MNFGTGTDTRLIAVTNAAAIC